jgi:hypothetical protein
MANHYQYSPEKPLLQPAGDSIGILRPVPAERHYAVAEIAEMWNLSADKVRELFENEPGVLVIGERSPRHREGMLRCVFLRLCSNGCILVYH